MADLRQFARNLIDRSDGSWLTRRDIRLDGLELLLPRPRSALRWRVLRVDDMVVLDLALHGLAVESSLQGRLLRRQNPTALLVVYFPPQAIAEQVYDDFSLTDQPSPLPPNALPAAARHAGLSRLAYRMPTGTETLPFTTAGILQAMADWPLERVVLPRFQPTISGYEADFGALVAEVASLLPQEHAARTSRIADRAARRAAGAVQGTSAASDVQDALGALSREVAAAARRFELDDDQSAALQAQAELGFAARVLARPGSAIDLDTAIGTLPGLFAFYLPRKPPETVTAIELPYRLVQSPNAAAAFSHARSPVTRQGRTELWHTRLGERADGQVVDATESPSTLAAIWSPDYGDGSEDGATFPMSLTAKDRDEIVRLTSDETGVLPGRLRRRYTPVPSRVDRLMLTALGGWLDLDGRWETRPVDDGGNEISLAGWKHHAALGRDWFVEIVRVGQMLPLGHRAAFITLTERRFQDAPDGSGRVAALRQRRFIEIREPLRSYPDATQPVAGRDFPLQTVEILTKRSPNLLPPAAPETVETFWPRIAAPGGNTDFRFEIRTTDIAGNVARFTLPLRFVSVNAQPAPAITQYNGTDQAVPGRTTAPLSGQIVQIAPAANRTDETGAPDPGDVVYPVQELRFGAAAPTSAPAAGSGLPRFHPAVRTLHIVSTTLAQLTGDDRAAEMAFAEIYRLNGFNPGPNKAEILLSAVGASPLQVDFTTRSSDKAGGIVTPNFGVSGTSRAFGLVGGDTNLLAGGTFNPDQFFPSAKIFGGIDLKDILAPVVVALAGATVPKLRTTRTREKIETVFEHRVENVPKSAPLLRMNERGTSKLDVKATLTAYFKVEDPSVLPIGSGPGGAGGNPPGLKEPDAAAEATLTWFKFNFFGCIIVSFDSFTFKASTSKGVDADPKIAATDGVVFGGPLAFIDTLRRTLSGSSSSGGGGGGGGSGGGGSSIPGFKVTPIFKPELTGLTVGVKLGLTTLPLGIFTLKNLMVSSAVKLPFDGKPLSVQFGFAERANPFQLVVGIFGGGGFVIIGVDTEHSVKEIEAALEFGAFAALDFGVASGSIYVKAGIYLYWNKPLEQTTLKGYVEMGGEVQVLGILSVSITLHLSLGYYKVGTVSEVRGQATLVIEVELLFFSASVNLTVERRFAGTESDPTFADLIPTAALWADYAEAFA